MAVLSYVDAIEAARFAVVLRAGKLRVELEECDEMDAREDIRRELTDTEQAVKALARLRRWT